MALERFKDVTIEGRTFRVGLVTAAIGSWITTQMMGGKASDFDVYQRMQNYLLSLCSIYKETAGGRVPMLILDNGKWQDPNLEYDLDTVDKILDASLEFNFSAFFLKRKAEREEAERKRLSAIQDTPQLNGQPT